MLCDLDGCRNLHGTVSPLSCAVPALVFVHAFPAGFAVTLNGMSTFTMSPGEIVASGVFAPSHRLQMCGIAAKAPKLAPPGYMIERETFGDRTYKEGVSKTVRTEMGRVIHMPDSVPLPGRTDLRIPPEPLPALPGTPLIDMPPEPFLLLDGERWYGFRFHVML